MFELPKNYRPSFVLALALHFVLLVFLIVELPKHSVGTNALYNAPQVIQARAVERDPAAVMQQHLHQQQVAQQKAAAAAEKQQKLAQQKAAAEQAALLKAQQAAAAKAAAQQKAFETAKKIALQKELAQAAAKPVVTKKPTPALTQKPAPQKPSPQKTAEQKKLAALAKEQQELQQKLMAEQLQNEQQELAKSQQLAVQGMADKYMAQIKAAVQQNWQQPFQNPSIFSVYEVKLAPGGVVLSVDLVQSSGNDVLDRSGKLAILKSSPLPVPQDAMVFNQFRDFKIKMTPQGAV